MKGFTARVPVTFNSRIASAVHDGSRFHIRISQGDGAQIERESEALLFCIGRMPNSDNIGIENTDLKPNSRGYIESDNRLRTPVEGVYANRRHRRPVYVHARSQLRANTSGSKSPRIATNLSTTGRCRTRFLPRLLHAVIPVMKWHNDIHSLVNMLYIHPSLAEVVRSAAA